LPEQIDAVLDIDLAVGADLDRLHLAAERLGQVARVVRRDGTSVVSPSVSKMMTFDCASLRRMRATAVPSPSPMAVALPSMTLRVISSALE